METEDSIATTLEDCGDYFHFKLVINENTQVEFFGKAYHMPPPPFYVEQTSIYELWIHKSNGLPYKNGEQCPMIYRWKLAVMWK